MTYPLIGNYGMNDDDYETDTPSISALVVGEYCDEPSNFRCSETQLQAAVNKINELILSFDTATVNDFYFEIGLKDTDDGGVFGWNVDSAHPMRITSDSYITCPVTGEHAKVISYNCKYLY